MPDDLRGADYRALVEITTTDPDDPRRVIVAAAIGETCARVPVESLGWLLAQHAIEPVRPPDEPLPHRRADDKPEGEG
jgi:hypothetical protein